MTPRRVHTAQLAGGDRNADRVFVTDQAVIVLDGATAFEPGAVHPASYADMLGHAITDRLIHHHDAPLAAVVAAAITETADRLTLAPGRSPSSTVTILRTRDQAADLYALGDSPVHYGTDHTATVFTDHRLAVVAPDECTHYVTRLRAGHGFDEHHRVALIALQRAQRQARNTPGGYWIAEADPQAAYHAVEQLVASDAIAWAVLATDGAAEYIDHVGLAWPTVAQHDGEHLAALLKQADAWETETDPDGHDLPRAKPHDDKTLAAIPAVW